MECQDVSVNLLLCQHLSAVSALKIQTYHLVAALHRLQVWQSDLSHAATSHESWHRAQGLLSPQPRIIQIIQSDGDSHTCKHHVLTETETPWALGQFFRSKIDDFSGPRQFGTQGRSSNSQEVLPSPWAADLSKHGPAGQAGVSGCWSMFSDLRHFWLFHYQPSTPVLKKKLSPSTSSNSKRSPPSPHFAAPRGTSWDLSRCPWPRPPAVPVLLPKPSDSLGWWPQKLPASPRRCCFFRYKWWSQAKCIKIVQRNVTEMQGFTHEEFGNLINVDLKYHLVLELNRHVPAAWGCIFCSTRFCASVQLRWLPKLLPLRPNWDLAQESKKDQQQALPTSFTCPIALDQDLVHPKVFLSATSRSLSSERFAASQRRAPQLMSLRWMSPVCRLPCNFASIWAKLTMCGSFLGRQATLPLLLEIGFTVATNQKALGK